MANTYSPTMRLVSYYFTPKVIIERQRNQVKIGPDRWGNPVIIRFSADRLHNGAAVLRLPVEHTTIPAPRVLGLWIVNFAVHLKMSLVPTNGIRLSQVDKSLRPIAVTEVTEQFGPLKPLLPLQSQG